MADPPPVPDGTDALIAENNARVPALVDDAEPASGGARVTSDEAELAVLKDIEREHGIRDDTPEGVDEESIDAFEADLETELGTVQADDTEQAADEGPTVSDVDYARAVSTMANHGWGDEDFKGLSRERILRLASKMPKPTETAAPAAAPKEPAKPAGPPRSKLVADILGDAAGLDEEQIKQVQELLAAGESDTAKARSEVADVRKLLRDQAEGTAFKGVKDAYGQVKFDADNRRELKSEAMTRFRAGVEHGRYEENAEGFGRAWMDAAKELYGLPKGGKNGRSTRPAGVNPSRRSTGRGDAKMTEDEFEKRAFIAADRNDQRALDSLLRKREAGLVVANTQTRN